MSDNHKEQAKHGKTQPFKPPSRSSTVSNNTDDAISIADLIPSIVEYYASSSNPTYISSDQLDNMIKASQKKRKYPTSSGKLPSSTDVGECHSKISNAPLDGNDISASRKQQRSLSIEKEIDDDRVPIASENFPLYNSSMAQAATNSNSSSTAKHLGCTDNHKHFFPSKVGTVSFPSCSSSKGMRTASSIIPDDANSHSRPASIKVSEIESLKDARSCYSSEESSSLDKKMFVTKAHTPFAQDVICSGRRKKPDNQDSLQRSTCKEETSSAVSNGFPHHISLALPEDKKWLTERECFLREYCLELFIASSDEVAAATNGRRNLVKIGQVGIRCNFCAKSPSGSRVNRAVSYPASVSRISKSVENFQVHFKSCKEIPEHIRAQYYQLKKKRVIGASDYRIDASKKIGLVDIETGGIRFKATPLPSHPSSLLFSRDGSSESLRALDHTVIVKHEDKPLASQFVYKLFEQMQRCTFTEKDRRGPRIKHQLGFSGIECVHCAQSGALGKYFPSKAKVLATPRSIDMIYAHIQKCKMSPEGIKNDLKRLKTDDMAQSSKLRKGTKQEFFNRVWMRIHDEIKDGNTSLVRTGCKSAICGIPQKDNICRVMTFCSGVNANEKLDNGVPHEASLIMKDTEEMGKDLSTAKHVWSDDMNLAYAKSFAEHYSKYREFY